MISHRFIFATETRGDKKKKTVRMSFYPTFERNPLLKRRVPSDDNSSYLVVKGNQGLCQLCFLVRSCNIPGYSRKFWIATCCRRLQ